MSKRGRWPGTWAAICDRCGFRFPSDQLIKDWTGLMVCRKDFETRHPQDFVRAVPDNQTPPWTRPEPTDVFIEPTYYDTPTLEIDFTTGVMPAEVTFTRSTTATYVNSNGALVTAAINEPRFQYDLYGNCLGYLSEETRINKCQTSKINPTSSNLTKSGDANATLTVVDDTAALAVAKLNGVCTNGAVYLLNNSAGSTNAYAEIPGPTGNTNTHIGSVYARGTGTIRVRSRVGSGTLYTLTTTYTRYTNSFTPADSVDRLWINAPAGSMVYFIIPQLEEGSFVTSPIVASDTSTTTRTGDQAVVSGSNFTNFYNATEGTILIQGTSEYSGVFADFGNGSPFGSTAYMGRGNSSFPAYVCTSGGAPLDISISLTATGPHYKIAFAMQANNFAASLGGAVPVSDAAPGVMPTADKLSIGKSGWGGGTANQPNGYISQLKYWPRRLSNKMLRELSST